MLVVTRKTDESILIADNIEVTVLEIGRDKIKLGINAPKEVKIIRSELKDAQQTNAQAAQTSSGVAELLRAHIKED